MKMKRALLSLGLCLTFLAAPSCRSGGVDNKPTAAEDNGNLKIGVCADASPAGQATKNGAQLAADEINKAGGVGGRRIELVVEDDGGTAEGASAAVARMTTQGRARAIVCGPSKASASAAAKAQETKVPILTTS